MAEGAIVRNWADNLKAEISAREGWKLVGKVVAGIIGAIAAVVSVLSFLDSQEEAQSSRTSERMAAIQTGLVADGVATRIAALKNLMTFAAEQTPPRSGDGRFRSEVFNFPRSALFDALQSAKEAPPELKDDQPSPQLGRRERTQLLQALTRMGNLGWWEPRPPGKPAATDGKVGLRFAWISKPAVGHADKGIPEPGTILNGFPFDDLSISQALFDCADLENARFPRSIIDQTSFLNANLSRANFKAAQIAFSRFQGSSLIHSNFDKARITGAYFTVEKGAACGRAGEAAQIDRSSLRHVEINDSDYSGSSLLGAVADDAFISGTHFDKIDASGLRLPRASLSNVSFRDAKLDGALFDGAVLSAVNFQGANLRNASFLDVRFQDAATWQSLLKADVTGANFMRAKGLPHRALCQLIMGGAVLVEDVGAWNRQGRPIGRFSAPKLGHSTDGALGCQK